MVWAIRFIPRIFWNNIRCILSQQCSCCYYWLYVRRIQLFSGKNYRFAILTIFGLLFCYFNSIYYRDTKQNKITLLSINPPLFKLLLFALFVYQNQRIGIWYDIHKEVILCQKILTCLFIFSILSRTRKSTPKLDGFGVVWYEK